MKTTNYTISPNGRISVPNLSAYWLPEQTVKKVIHGTTYVVTGTYEGTELFTQKLKRIMARNFASEATENDEKSEE